jgi:hypothetical protein
MIEAFSTSCSSAKASSSVGDLSFKSCSLISCIGMKSLEGQHKSGRAKEEGNGAIRSGKTGADALNAARDQHQNYMSSCEGMSYK